MNRIANRKQRREAMKGQGILRMIGQLSYTKRAEIRQANLARGREAHTAMTDHVDKDRWARLESKEIEMMKTWKEIGYNDEEISLLREAWSINVVGGASREDIKKSADLVKSADESLHNRLGS
jgi:hypothetical protein